MNNLSSNWIEFELQPNETRIWPATSIIKGANEINFVVSFTIFIQVLLAIRESCLWTFFPSVVFRKILLTPLLAISEIIWSIALIFDYRVINRIGPELLHF